MSKDNTLFIDLSFSQNIYTLLKFLLSAAFIIVIHENDY